MVDALFRDAVSAIDEGDVQSLKGLLDQHPELVRDRLRAPGPWLREKVGEALDGFFREPFLLWFVAEDPVRNGKLPQNIAEVARTLIEVAQTAAVETLQEQLDYALTLVSWSWVARECGVQIGLIDCLLDAGAAPDGNANNALVNGNFGAAGHLVGRGATYSLATAVCLDRSADFDRLARESSEREKQFALVLAALNGKHVAIRRLLAMGLDVNKPSQDLYSHGTPLHHSVCSGSLETVKTLVEAGADVNTQDTAWSGTPLGWAEYYVDQHEQDPPGKEYRAIAEYLSGHRSTIHVTS